MGEAGTAGLVFAAVLGLDLLTSAWFLLRQVLRRLRERRSRRIREALGRLLEAAADGVPWSGPALFEPFGR